MKFISVMMQNINNVIVYNILISIKPINKINWSFKNVLTTYAKSDSSMVN
jgi:hypothetical protein